MTHFVWKANFSCIVAGPSQCGKTQFTIRLIRHANEVIDPPPERILWCYSVYQSTFDQLANLGVQFNEGLPELSTLDGKQRTLLILDDLMHETDCRVTKIFTKISHHMNVSVVYLVQNLFNSGNKEARTISLNTSYMIIFRNPRDASQIAILAKQMYPGRSKALIESFNDATSTPYSYLMIDLKADTDDRYRLRTGLFPGDTAYVYVPK